jgi:hypothetical protein
MSHKIQLTAMGTSSTSLPLTSPISWLSKPISFLKCHNIQNSGRLYGRGSIPVRDQNIFAFSTASGLALGPIQPPIQWVPGLLPRE